MKETICPRCAKVAIEVRSFGAAGKLFVHSYEDQKLGKLTIQAANGCHVHTSELENGPRWTHQSQNISR